MGERNRTYSVIILFLLPLCLYGRDSVDSVNRLAADYVQASLVVCDPDDVLYSTLGHAALHLVCPTYDADLYFTYEGESVRNNVAKFLMVFFCLFEKKCTIFVAIFLAFFVCAYARARDIRNEK